MVTSKAHHVVALCLAVTAGLSATAGAASAPASGQPSDSSAPPSVKRVARELAAHAGGATSVMVFVSAHGKEYLATAGAHRPTADQRFRVGSVTKTFTATMVLQLVEEGKLRLSSTLEDHLPGVVPRGSEITMRQLLSHRSGLLNYTDDWSWFHKASRSSSTRPIDLLRFSGSRPLAFDPGSKFHYSNTNYIALGLIIEKVTGRSYAHELESRILHPLQLDDTELPKTWRLPDLDDGGENPNAFWAAGAIVSTAQDTSRFFSSLFSGRLLSKSSLATMTKSVLVARHSGNLPLVADGPLGVGLGIFTTKLPCGRVWFHAGGLLDYVTFVGASERGDRVVVVSVRKPPADPPDRVVRQSSLFCAG